MPTTIPSRYLIRVAVPDVQSLERFIVDELSKIPGVANIRPSFALKQVKYKSALPPPDRKNDSTSTKCP